MHSIFPAATLAALSGLVALVAGQASSTVSPSMPPEATQGFDIAPVPENKRFQWCLAQKNNCPLICGGSFEVNNCDEGDLSYECVCRNGTVPDVSAFRETIPFYLCEETFQQCIKANPKDAQGQATCTNNQQCGTRNATMVEDSSSSGATGGSDGSSAAATASQPATSANSDQNAGSENAAIAVSQHVTNGALAALFAVGFKLLL